jgi:uncharacterized caspase-like protein
MPRLLLFSLLPLVASVARAAEPVGHPAADPRRWALIIGVTRYTDTASLPELRGPSNDARTLTDALITHGHFDPQQVTVLAEGATPPTHDNIIRALSTITRSIGDDGLLIVAFSGHGIAPGDEAYLLPSNVVDVDRPDSFGFRRSAIAVSDVRELIQQSSARSVVLFIDACRDDPWGRARGASNVSLRHTERFQRAFAFNSGPADKVKVREIVTFFSSHPGQQSFETPETPGKPSVGYFSDALVRALRGEVADARRADGSVTAASMFGFVTGEVSRRVRKDFPNRDQNPLVMLGGGADVPLTFVKDAPFVLTPPGPNNGPDSNPSELPKLQFRLPPTAARNPHLVVARNHFTIPAADASSALPVPPGRQFVEVRLPGYRSWTREVEVVRGVVDLDVSLTPQRTWIWMGLAAAGAGVGATLTGLYFGARAQSAADDVTTGCRTDCTWRDLAARDHGGRRDATLSKVLIGTGVPLVGVGLGVAAYFHLSRPPLAPERVAVVPVGGGAALAASGRW